MKRKYSKNVFYLFSFSCAIAAGDAVLVKKKFDYEGYKPQSTSQPTFLL